jgi:hypothetical protein
VAELPASGNAETPMHDDPPICFRGTRQIAQIRALAPHEPASHANAILDDFGEF